MNLIFPMLAQVAWTLIVGVMTARVRFRSVANRDVRVRDIALGNSAWPDKVKAFGNNFSNQFETPVLFYVLCGVAVHVGATNWPIVVLAWIYVATRIGHTLVHTGSNNIRLRFRLFAAGLAALLAMLVVVSLKAL